MKFSVSKLSLLVCTIALVMSVLGFVIEEDTSSLITKYHTEWLGVFFTGLLFYFVNRILDKKRKREKLEGVIKNFQMNSVSIALVQNGFKHLDQEEFSTLFYKKLFTAHPKIKSLFKGNMEEQRNLLYEMICYLVAKSNSDEVVNLLLDLSRTHMGYGVKKKYYDAFVKVLSETLIELKIENYEHWIVVFKSFTTIMKSVYSEENKN